MDDYNKVMLALVMWREARGEGRDGMAAVGLVIRNRVEATPDKAWAHVITAKWQFSSMTATNDTQLAVWPQINDPHWLDAMAIADQIYSGVIDDITGGATHYFNAGVVWPTWADRMTQTAIIGHHTFFK